jgi:hypothetical protein
MGIEREQRIETFKKKEQKPSLRSKLILLGSVGLSSALFACGETEERGADNTSQPIAEPTTSFVQTEMATPTQVIFETRPPRTLPPAPKDGEPLIDMSLPQAESWEGLVQWIKDNGGLLVDNENVSITFNNQVIPESGPEPTAVATARKAQSLDEAVAHVQPYLDELCEKTGARPPEGEFVVQTNTESAKGQVSITCTE